MKDEEFLNFTPCRSFLVWKNGTGKTLQILVNVAPVKFNKTAAFIWLRCNGRTKISTIVSDMNREYPAISKSTIYEDIKNFIHSAEQAGLLHSNWNSF